MLRENGTDSNDISLYSNTIIAEISQQDLCSYADKNMPYAASVKYQIATSSCEGMIYSNIIMLKRNITIFNLNSISNVLIDKDSSKLHIFSSDYYGSTITSYDYSQGKITKNLSINYSAYVACIADYNGTKELYIADYNNYPYKIYIYNSNTLAMINNFPINNYTNAIAALNGKIFINNSYNYDGAIECFSRNTLASLDSEGPTYTSLKIFAIPNTNTSLIGISSYDDIYKINFNSSGQGIGYSHNTANFNNTDNFQMSPLGNYFVGDQDGKIFSTSDLSLVATLGYYSYYSGFAFNNDDSKIYAIQNSTQLIDEYSMPSGTKTKSYTTHGFPTRIFIDDNKIISLSKIENYSSSYVVEKISIN